MHVLKPEAINITRKNIQNVLTNIKKKKSHIYLYVYKYIRSIQKRMGIHLCTKQEKNKGREQKADKKAGRGRGAGVWGMQGFCVGYQEQSRMGRRPRRTLGPSAALRVAFVVLDQRTEIKCDDMEGGRGAGPCVCRRKDANSSFKTCM